MPEFVDEVAFVGNPLSMPDSIFDVRSVAIESKLAYDFILSKSNEIKKIKFLKLFQITTFNSKGLHNLIKLEINKLNCDINNIPPNLTELKIISFNE